MSSRTENDAGTPIEKPEQAGTRRPRWRRLAGNTGIQVLIAAIAAAIFGIVWSEPASELKPLADVFISLIRLVIPPIVFLVVVTGIVSVGGMKAVGRIALRAIIYFEIVTTVGTLLGLISINLFRPGAGVAPPADASNELSSYVEGEEKKSISEFFLDMVPDNAVNALATGDIIQVLIFAILFSVALLALPKDVSDPVLRGCSRLSEIFFSMVRMVIRLAPIGTFGAVSYTVGKYGPETLTALMKYVGLAFATVLVFLTLVLGTVTWLCGVSLVRLIRGLRHELYIVLGTSSSETVMPHLMARLEQFGCRRNVVGLVVPTGYSFNLDGVAVVVPMSAVFIAQVYGVSLSFTDQLTLFLVFLLLSKGTAGVTGSAFITLANLVSTVDFIPVAGLALILSIERFLSLMRACTNVLGNAVAGIAVARWEPDGADEEQLMRSIGRRRRRRRAMAEPEPVLMTKTEV